MLWLLVHFWNIMEIQKLCTRKVLEWSVELGLFFDEKVHCDHGRLRASFKDPNEKAPMIAYDPNALRNRLPVKFDNAAEPFRRFCAPRNNHTYE